jgi:parvulin-like peptidyl-prolyl isomerase
MRRAMFMLALSVGMAGAPLTPSAQQVVDRIVARIEDDIITLSEVRELGRYQQLVQGSSEDDDRLLAELIDQWIVNSEATAARFPRPIEAEVNRELDRLEKQFASPEAYRARLQELGLSATVRRIVERQLYLVRYLDYKFRPTSQVDAEAIEKYYREQLTPQLTARGQTVPPLESVEDEIRELLTERQISERASRWLDETRSRLKIELQAKGT